MAKDNGNGNVVQGGVYLVPVAGGKKVSVVDANRGNEMPHGIPLTLRDADNPFSTGSQGLSFSGALLVNGTKYNVSINLVRSGSKPGSKPAAVAGKTAVDF